MGKSIRIYLADNDPADIRLAEILNWTGQGLAFPRAKTSIIKDWEEANRQGVYFLFGHDENGSEAVYIGEAEKVSERVIQHVKTKEFWKECVAFTSKDENLTKAHVKYLESKFIIEAKNSGRYSVENSIESQQSALPRGDKDAMDEFGEQVKVLLGVLGHRVLEPISATIQTLPNNQDVQAAIALQQDGATFSEQEFSINGGYAKLIRKANELVVTKGSKAQSEAKASLGPGYAAFRTRLIAAGVLEKQGGDYCFTRDYAFDSPSAAACVIVGYTINGRTAWKNSEGKSIKDVEEIELSDSSAAFTESQEIRSQYAVIGELLHKPSNIPSPQTNAAEIDGVEN